MNPVEALEALITKLFAKKVGVIVTDVPTKALEVNVRVWAEVTELANPRPSKVATPFTAFTVKDWVRRTPFRISAAEDVTVTGLFEENSVPSRLVS
jgi:hypothetical protein